MSLLVIGTVAYDTIETAYTRRENVLGGSAMYFSIAAAKYTKPALVAVVGEDFRPEHTKLLKDNGVDTQGLEMQKGRTFRWSGRYEVDWNTRVTLETQLNVLETFDPKIPQEWRAAKYVFLANAAPAVQLRALEQIDRPTFVMADTMNLWIETSREDLKKLLRKVDAIVLNDEEARILTGERNLIRAAGMVLGMGPKYVLLKKGEHGAFIMGSDVHFSLPAYPVEQVIDPTGAGDTFAGGFMGHVAASDRCDPPTLRRAMLWGTVTASFCVQGFGPEALVARTQAELASRYDDLMTIVSP
jgi:sugar/nucleoside kinase (ribokinase family)